MINVTLRQKIYAGAMCLALVFGLFVWQSLRWKFASQRVEREAEVIKNRAVESEAAAASAAAAAERNAGRAEYLNQQIGEIRDLAQQQNEKIKILNADTDSARSRVERARRVGSIESTADELCAKLETLGHSCVR